MAEADLTEYIKQAIDGKDYDLALYLVRLALVTRSHTNNNINTQK